MIPTVWDHVRPGAVVLLRREPWFVTARTGHAFTVRHPASGRVVGPRALPPGDAVTVLEPGDPAYVAPDRDAAAEAMLAPLSESARGRLAVAAARIHLGARVLAVETSDGLVCHTADRWHVLLFHELTCELPDAAPDEVVHTVHATSAATRPHKHDDETVPIPHPA